MEFCWSDARLRSPDVAGIVIAERAQKADSRFVERLGKPHLHAAKSNDSGAKNRSSESHPTLRIFFFTMNLQTKINLAACDRDLRLDFTRGIAIWFLFLDHIPNNVVSLLTVRNFGFSGATDLFVFAAGYAAAIFYGKMLLERGLLVAATRIFKRVCHLYAAYVVLFVIYVGTITYVAAQYAAPAIIAEFNISG